MGVPHLPIGLHNMRNLVIEISMSNLMRARVADRAIVTNAREAIRRSQILLAEMDNAAVPPTSRTAISRDREPTDHAGDHVVRPPGLRENRH